ncbi:MAG: hypothetical protein IT495_10005 [Gammaproteobacteria bacterium]|nr:hypothetical protein [Gammaproteobacteria bacterium]
MIANHLDDDDLAGLDLPAGINVAPFLFDRDSRRYLLDRPASPVELLRAARVLAGAVHARTGVTIADWRELEPALALELAGSPIEVFGAAFLAADGSLLSCEALTRGEFGRVEAPVAELARRAVQLSAYGIIAWHSHPPGSDPRPSALDLAWFARARALLTEMRMDLRDFLVITGLRAVSCTEYLAEAREHHPRAQIEDVSTYARLLCRALWRSLLASVRAVWRAFTSPQP